MNRPAESVPALPSATLSGIHLLEVFVDNLNRLSTEPGSRQSFYAWLTDKSLALLNADRALLAVKSKHGNVRVLAQRCSLTANPSAPAELLDSLSQIDRPMNQQTGVEKIEVGGVTTLVAQCSISEAECILFALTPKPLSSKAEVQLWADLSQEIGSAIVTFEGHRSHRILADKQADSTALVRAMENIASSTNRRELASHLVNDLSRLCRAGRVWFFRPNGKTVACSGASSISRRAPIVRLLRTQVVAACRINQTRDHVDLAIRKGRGMPTDDWGSIQSESNAQEILIVPLHDATRKTNLGALVLEFFDETAEDWSERRERVEIVIRQMVPFVRSSARILEIPWLRFGLWFGSSWIARPLRFLTLLTLLLGIGFFASWLLFFQTRPFEIFANGVLTPQHKRNVFAEVPGLVSNVLVREGESVQVGQTLIQMQSLELEQESAKTDGELAEALQAMVGLQLALSQDNNRSQEPKANRVQQTAEIEQLKIRVETLRQTARFLDDRKKLLVVKAPITGTVVTAETEQRLTNRPVVAGERLLEVADTNGEWQVELDIDDRLVGYLTRRQKEIESDLVVRFRLASDPDNVVSGSLVKLDFKAIADQQGMSGSFRMVRGFVDFDETALAGELRQGTGVVARTDCGVRTPWFLLTYELRDKLRSWFFY